MRNWLLLVGVCAVLWLSVGCAGVYGAPVTPSSGLLFARIDAPLSLNYDQTSVTEKRGEASTESILGLIAIGAGLRYGGLMAVQFPEGGAGNPVLAFALGMGLLTKQALGIPVYIGTIFGLLMVEGFLITTLDTAVRLNRYLFEELWTFLWGEKVPALLKHHYFNAGLAVVVMLALAIPNGYSAIWPVFGTANQLLAALTLATVSIWLAFRLRPTWFTLIPAIFMMLTCLGSLSLILNAQLAALASPELKVNWAVLILSLLLALLGIGVVWLAASRLYEVYSGRREPIRSDPADVYLNPTLPSIAE